MEKITSPPYFNKISYTWQSILFTSFSKYEILFLTVSDARVQLEKAEIDEDHLDNKEFYHNQIINAKTEGGCGSFIEPWCNNLHKRVPRFSFGMMRVIGMKAIFRLFFTIYRQSWHFRIIFTVLVICDIKTLLWNSIRKKWKLPIHGDI